MTRGNWSQQECARYDTLSDDGTTIRTFEYVNCTGGATVLLYVVEGGGHTWPGGSQYLPESIIGRTSNEIDGMETIWAFLSQFSK